VFRFETLKQWRWYDLPGRIVFRFDPETNGEKAIGSPCKLPQQWAEFFTEASGLREKHRTWFSTDVTKADMDTMRNGTTSTNPLWRLVIAFRLLELNQLRREDIERTLAASYGKPLEMASLLVLLLNAGVSYEEEVMEKVRSIGLFPGTSEGIALGCLTSAAGRPRAVERAFDSMKLERQLKAQTGASLQTKHKMIDSMFQGNDGLEYRIAHKLHIMITETNDVLLQKVESILGYMLEP
jgi:hypothetical protein